MTTLGCRVIQPAAVIVSWLIAAAGLLEPDADRALIGVVLAGMGIAIIGDFLNIDMENLRNVLRGLVIAVFAYMTYAIGLTALTASTRRTRSSEPYCWWATSSSIA